LSALIEDEDNNKSNDEDEVKLPRSSFDINSKDDEIANTLKVPQADFGLLINYEEDDEAEQNNQDDDGNFLPEMIKDDEFEGDFDNN